MNDLDADDLATVAELRAQFDPVVLDRPAPRRLRSSRLPMLVTAAAVLAVALTAVAIARGGGDHPVYAGWTPTSRAATADETAAIIPGCNERMDDASSTGTTFGPGSRAEVRGDFALLIASGDAAGGHAICLARARHPGWYVFGLGKGAPSPSPGILGFGSDGELVSVLVGTSTRADAVRLELPGLPEATAPVIGGVYAMWWPGTTDADDGLPKLHLDLLRDDQVIDTVDW